MSGRSYFAVTFEQLGKQYAVDYDKARKKRHEHHVAFAAFRQLTAGGDTFVVAVQHDLEQYRRAVGQASGLVVGATGGKRRMINVLIDDLFGGYWKDPGRIWSRTFIIPSPWPLPEGEGNKMHLTRTVTKHSRSR